MKKIVGTSVIVIIELLIGTLFLLGLFHSKKEVDNLSVIENNNLSKMADAVNVMFEANTAENAFHVGPVVKKEEEKKEEEKHEEVKQEEKKEEKVVENKEEAPKVEEKKEEVVPKQEEPVAKKVEEKPVSDVIKSYTGTLTGYGPDCRGCSGNTASGYYVGNTITYNDATYGNVRIVAADRSIPFYSIVRISNIPGMDTITAIVLDTGGAVGFGKATLFDLLFASEASAMNKTYNVKFDILRWGGA